MKLFYKILAGLGILLFLIITSFAVVISRDSDCQSLPEVAAGTETMKAVMYNCYGAPEVLQLVDVEKPQPEDHQMLVKVEAASVNPLDWHHMRGSPYIMRLSTGIGAPEEPSMGVDFAGIIVEVGKDVSEYKIGDEIFGGRTGSFGEYVLVSESSSIARKPANMSFEEAASVPIAAVTALQAVRDHGNLQPGQQVLINGASGGVGTFAVQIAKSMGAEVTGVCSTRNQELVRGIGADHMFDYTQEDYTQSGKKYDLIVDMVGNHSISKNRDVLKPGGSLVIVGGSKGNWIAPLIYPIAAMITQPFVEENLTFFVADLLPEDLAYLGRLMETGEMKPVIEKTYRLSEIQEAVAHSESGRARGKLAVSMQSF